MPEEKWKNAQEKMIKPMLLRISVLCPKVMPPAWITELPSPKPSELTPAQEQYYQACEAAQMPLGVKPPKKILKLLCGVVMSAESSIEGFMMRTDLQSVSVQLLEFIGRDLVMDYVDSFANESVDWVEVNAKEQAWLANWLRVVGARHYGLRLVAGFQADIVVKIAKHKGKTRNGMRGLWNAQQSLMSLERAMQMDSTEARDAALAMATHPRLGGESALGVLGSELLEMCAGMAEGVELVRWQDVLAL